MSKDLSSVFAGEISRPIRSTFLTVLCVLTFIGSGWEVLKSIPTIATPQKMAKLARGGQTEAERAKMQEDISKKDNKGSKFALKLMEQSGDFQDPVKIRQSGIIKLIASLLTLSGAILMFRLRKPGFYFYVVGCLVEVASIVVIYGAENFVAKMSALFIGVVNIAFIIMYSFCLKDMKKKVLE